MARIVYKKGLEGQNRLECIEGIEIELLNWQKALIYPRYSKEVMLPKDKIEFWDVKENSEIEALKKEDNLWATGALLRCGSPAAEYVSNFRSDKYGIFGLPTLLAAMDLYHQNEDIDALAETIEGAHLLRDFIVGVCSCTRYSEDCGWIASDFGFAIGDILCNSYLVVPLVLYR